MNNIKWKENEQTITQEMTSLDNRWSISQNQGLNDSCLITLFNHELITPPTGIGDDYKGCFKSFIDNCDEYMRKLIIARTEAASHLADMINIAKQLEGEK